MLGPSYHGIPRRAYEEAELSGSCEVRAPSILLGSKLGDGERDTSNSRTGVFKACTVLQARRLEDPSAVLEN